MPPLLEKRAVLWPMLITKWGFRVFLWHPVIVSASCDTGSGPHTFPALFLTSALEFAELRLNVQGCDHISIRAGVRVFHRRLVHAVVLLRESVRCGLAARIKQGVA